LQLYLQEGEGIESGDVESEAVDVGNGLVAGFVDLGESRQIEVEAADLTRDAGHVGAGHDDDAQPRGQQKQTRRVPSHGGVSTLRQIIALFMNDEASLTNKPTETPPLPQNKQCQMKKKRRNMRERDDRGVSPLS